MDKNKKKKENNDTLNIQPRIENTISRKDLITLSTKIEEDCFLDINNLNKLLYENNKVFFQNIELIELINVGSSGVVYSGRGRKNPNSSKYAFKFLFYKKIKMKY